LHADCTDRRYDQLTKISKIVGFFSLAMTMAIERLEGMGSKHLAVTTIYRFFEIFAALRIRPAGQLQLRIFAVQLMLLPEPLAHTCAPCVHTAAMRTMMCPGCC
jgi:hypothetical protein